MLLCNARSVRLEKKERKKKKGKRKSINVKNSVPTIVCFKNEASPTRCVSERSIKIKKERYRYAVIKRAGSSVLVRSEPGAELIDF